MPTTQELIDIVIGPQAPMGTTYFDRTQLGRGRFHADSFPATPPPADQVDGEYANANYYDLSQNMYALNRRTGDPADLARGRKIADSWYLCPYSDSGRTNNFFDGQGTSPKFAGVGGLTCRAIDGRPEMWDWINRYTRHSLNLWIHRRMNVERTAPDPTTDIQLREAAFSLHFAFWLSKVLPDSFPLTAGGIAINGAELRAQYLADVENVTVNYFSKLQQADGSYRWDDWYENGDDGSLLKGIMQPFMVGMTMWPLCDIHAFTANATVKESAKNQILKACRHLYSDGPYARGLATNFGVQVRGFHYFYHGGTELNRTRYERGDFPFNTTERWHVSSARQLIATVLPAFGYAFKISGDSFFKLAGDELWDSCYGGGDQFRAMMDDVKPKLYNQHARRVGSYLVWAGGSPAPLPVPQPTPEPIPSTTPSPDGTKAGTIIDSTGATWTIGPQKQTLRDGTQAGGGQGTIYKVVDKTVHVLGLDSNWYKWAGSWSSVGPVEPGVVVPDPLPAPAPTPVPPTPPTPTPLPQPAPTVPTLRPVTWPKQESKQNSILDTQWRDKYRLKRISGGMAEFEKVS